MNTGWPRSFQLHLKPEPPKLPWRVRVRSFVWHQVTWWPWQVRLLKRGGFRRTGWRKWEYP